MKSLTASGRVLFAIALVAFGIQHLIYACLGAGFGPPWTPENQLLAYVTGIVFIVAGVGIAIGRQVLLAAIVLGGVCFARALFYYAPKIAAAPRDPTYWTGAFELLMICGASLILAAPLATAGTQRSCLLFGRVLFASSLIVFGLQHLTYGPFVAGLIPVWIPLRLSWAYFVGVAFIAAALAIVTGMLASLASNLLGSMFLLWVVILHGPRVAGAIHNGNEWTSLLVALAASGGAFILAEILPWRTMLPTAPG